MQRGVLNGKKGKITFIARYYRQNAVKKPRVTSVGVEYRPLSPFRGLGSFLLIPQRLYRIFTGSPPALPENR